MYRINIITCVVGLLLWPGLTLPATLRAQQVDLHVEHLTQAHGLSNNVVIAMVQDHQGFMWFGTHDGLNKYDGYQTTIYRHDSSDSTSLSASWVEALYVDRQGTLWVGTYGGGLDRFSPSTETFTHYRHDPDDPTSLSHNEVVAIFEDTQGVLWVGTHGGLNRFDRQTETFTRYLHDPADSTSLSHDRVRVIYEDKHSTLWIGTGDPWDYTPKRGGLNRFDRETETFTQYGHHPQDEHSLVDNRITAIYEDSRGRLWIATWGNGLHSMDRERGRFTRHRYDPDNPGRLSRPYLRSEPPFSGTTFVHEDQEGRLWIGAYNGGLNRYDPVTETLTHFEHDPTRPNSLSSNNMYTMYETPDGVLWLGTYNGVNKISPIHGAFRHYEHDPDDPNSLSHGSILGIYEDSRGVLWIGTEGGGLNRLDRQTGRFTHYRHDPHDPTSLSHNRVRVIYEDSRGVLWIGTEGGGLNRLDRQTGRFTHYRHSPDDPNSLSSDIIFSIQGDESGALWMGTAGGILNKLDRQTGRFSRYQPGSVDPNNRIEAIHEDQEGMLWVGVWNSGLNRFNPATETFEAFLRDHANSNYVKSIYEDQEGILWVGTEGNGLYRFNPDTKAFKHYATKDGLPSNAITGILSGREDDLWLSTTNGLSQFNRQTETFSNFSTTDGLQGNVFHFGSSFKSKSGELFFGGNNGLNAFFPNRVKANTHVPPIVLTSFTLLNREGPVDRAVSEIDHLRLSYQDKVVAFEFAALNYAASEKNQYAYKLEGFDEDWVALGTKRDVTFTNLDPGDYVLRVRGSNNSGVWNETGLSLRLTVEPPFWGAWWFRALMAVGILGVLLKVYQARTRSIRVRNRALQAEVTVRKRAEEAVKASEDRLRLALDAARMGTWNWDTRTNEITWSERVEVIFGLPPGTFDGTYETYLGLIHPDDLGTVKDKIAEALAGGQDYEVQHRICWPDGSIRWLGGKGHVYRNAAGHPIRMAGTVADITERKQVEERVRYQADLLEKVSDAIISTDMDFTILSWNKAAEAIYGRCAEDVVGKSTMEVLQTEYPNGDKDVALATFLAEGFWQGEVIQRRSDGTAVDIFASVSLIRDARGTALGAVAVNRNITERKKADQALQEGEERFRYLYNNTPVMLHSIDRTGRLLSVSDFWLETLGYERSEVIGRPAPDFLTEASRRYAKEVVLPALFKTGVARDISYQFVKKNGEVFDVLLSAIAERDEAGEIMRSLAVIIDVTERKRIEEEREALIADLEQRNAEMERFTYTVSHDLKTPLVTINSFVSLLQHDVACGNAERVKTDIEHILSATRTMRRLLNDLLELSRIGCLVNPFEAIALEDLVHEAITLTDGQIKERGVRVSIAPSMPMVYGDRVRLLEVFQNLIDNAVKFMGDQLDPYIEIAARQEAEAVVCTVADNGIGVKAKYQEKIFGLFERLDPHIDGTGVGLALVKRIVEVHSGKVWVESEGEGSGSTFWFVLPGYDANVANE